MHVLTRRSFLGAGAALCAWYFAANAKDQSAQRVAVVFTTTPLPAMQGPRPEHPGLRAFLEALATAGYVPGRNLIYEPRSAEGKYDRYPEIFAELVRANADVIVTIGEDMARKAREATATIPIVMAFSNYPVEAGLVRTLARPGGNVTGISYNPGELEGKRLELLREAIPKLSRVAFLGLRSEWESPIGQSVRAAAARLGLSLSLAENTPTDYAAAFAALARDRPDALFVANSPVNFGHRDRIVELVTKARLPATYPVKQYVAAGGLMSYGIDLPDQFRRAAAIVVKLLKGANPAETPIEQPTKFELTINLRTAGQLGIALPPTLLQRADEVFR